MNPLRPVVERVANGLRPTVDRVWVGGGLLIRRAGGGCAAWARAGSSVGDTVARLVALAVVGYVGWVVVRGAPVLLWPLMAVLLVRAYRAGPPALSAPGQTPGSTTPPTGPEPAPETVPDVPTEEFMSLLQHAIGDARGVHLATLVEHLSRAYPGGWDIAAVRALCQAAGVAVTPTVRAPGRKPTVGIYREGIPGLASAPPQGPPVVVVVAGQNPTTSPTTPSTTAPTTPTESVIGGYRVQSTDDPNNPARTYVTVTKEKTNR